TPPVAYGPSLLAADDPAWSMSASSLKLIKQLAPGSPRQHLNHIIARDRRPKQAFLADLANVCDLVAYWSYLAHRRLQPALQVVDVGEPGPDLLPHCICKQ